MLGGALMLLRVDFERISLSKETVNHAEMQ
jgi:hypothetical protein